MAGSRPATHGHTCIELHWNATSTPSIGHAIVEELDDDGNDEADRRSATRQTASTTSRVGKYELARKLKTHSNLADGCPSVAGITDYDSDLDATKVHGPHSSPSEVLSWTLPDTYGLDDRSTLNHTGAIWADASISESDIVMSDAVSGDELASTRPQKRKMLSQGLMFDQVGGYNAQHAKRQRYYGLAESSRDGDTAIRDVDAHRARPGHVYNRVQASGHARMHMGDYINEQVVINHNYLGLFAAMDMRLAQNTEASEKAAILRLAASIVVVVILNALVRVLLPLRSAMRRAMPQLMQNRVPILQNSLDTHAVLFEDALGRFDRIDLHVVANWTAFHYKLTCAFANKPGYRRVAVADYRLFNRNRSDQLINPRRPPPFDSVFRANSHIRMSIHFKLSELYIESCPICGVDKLCESGIETTCKNMQCGSHYRGHVEEQPKKFGCGDIENDQRDSNENHGDVRQEFLQDVKENHAPFSRISVTKQPTMHLPLHENAAATASFRTRMMSSMIQVQYERGDIAPGLAQLEYGARSAHGYERPRERVWICFHPGCVRDDGGPFSFTRKDDFNRHLQKHTLYRPLYDCPVMGCHRVNENGLPRQDKLFEHIRAVHRIREA